MQSEILRNAGFYTFLTNDFFIPSRFCDKRSHGAQEKEVIRSGRLLPAPSGGSDGKKEKHLSMLRLRL